MSPKRVRGTIGLPEAQGYLQRTICSSVCLDGIETYQLCFSCRGFRTAAKYELFDQHRHLIQTWEFAERFFTKTLDLSIIPDFPLRYERRIFSRDFLITPEGKRRTYMELTSNSRSFELDDLKFTHRDFQSHISFSCPIGRTHQTILLALILFIPPHFNEPH